jgi:hypothetical protein
MRAINLSLMAEAAVAAMSLPAPTTRHKRDDLAAMHSA